MPSCEEKKAVFLAVINLCGIIVTIRRPVRFLLSFSEIIKMANRGRKKRAVTQTEEQNNQSYSNAMRTKLHIKLSI